MKKLNELVYNQMQLVKFKNESKTREERGFYTEQINLVEELIEQERKNLGLR